MLLEIQPSPMEKGKSRNKTESFSLPASKISPIALSYHYRGQIIANGRAPYY